MTSRPNTEEDRVSWPAAARNRDVILRHLRAALPASGRVLEIGSGTGQHIAWFAESLPHLEFQPSDRDGSLFGSIAAWTAGLANVRPPLVLDASQDAWPVEEAEAIYCANVVHISPIEVLDGLLRGAGRTLTVGGLLALYGPYLVDGKPTTESNAAFDRSLKRRDPRFGLRDREAVASQAAGHGLIHEEAQSMPANNFLLLFRRGP